MVPLVVLKISSVITKAFPVNLPEMISDSMVFLIV